MKINKEEIELRKELLNGGIYFWRSLIYTLLRQDKTEQLEYNRINYEIRNILKQKVIEQQKTKGKIMVSGPHTMLLDLQNKSNKAKASATLSLNSSIPKMKLNVSHRFGQDSSLDFIK